jgi:hypothetical protein
MCLSSTYFDHVEHHWRLSDKCEIKLMVDEKNTNKMETKILWAADSSTNSHTVAATVSFKLSFSRSFETLSFTHRCGDGYRMKNISTYLLFVFLVEIIDITSNFICIKRPFIMSSSLPRSSSVIVELNIVGRHQNTEPG